MKQPRISRRQFFKLAGFSAVAAAGLPAIGLASIAAAPSQEAIAAAEQPQGPAIPQPTFNPMASNTTFGPLTDISMGWDGTLWGIDGQGAPHVYDEINKIWAQHGDGIDAAALDGAFQTLYVFQGPNVVPINAANMTAGAPTTIAALWPDLPDSFKLGVNGAMTSRDGNGLILFNGGRYASTDGTVTSGKLVNLKGWPKTAPWTVNAGNTTLEDAVMDAGFTLITEGSQFLLRAGQVLRVRIFNGDMDVPSAPVSFASFVQNFGAPLPVDWVNSGGVDACALTNADANQTPNLFFKGMSVLSYIPVGSSLTTMQYIGKAFNNWPATWHPVLQHAPNGRDGNLWSVLPQSQGGWTMQHNGDAWVQLPNQADHVGVGQDNTVMLASAGRLWKFTGAYDGTGFTPLTPPSDLKQVSLGHASAVFARDGSNNVYSFDPSTSALTPNADASANGGATHIATTSDGSLWHAKPSDPNMHRQLVGSGAAPEAIPVKQGLTATVSKVAGTGFGAAHCLTQDSQGNTQAYRYDSPYVFKTAAQYNVNSATGTSLYVEQGAGLLFVLDGKVISDNPFVFSSQVVAIDAHTGVEVARKPQLPNAAMNYGQPVFDSLNNLLYVTTYNAPDATDNTMPGQLLALDPRTLAVKWSFTAPASMDAPALLAGTRLFVSDRTGKLYMFDTTAALANPANVQAGWTVNVAAHVPPTSASTYRITQPAYVPVTAPGFPSDLIYIAVWLYDYSGGRNAEVTSGYWMSVWAGDGSINDAPQGLHNSNDPFFGFATLVTAPARGTLNVGSESAPNYSPALYYNCYDRVIAIGSGPTAKTFPLPAGDYITTGFTYDDGRNTSNGLSSTGLPPGAGWLWFGTYTGQLYCLDTSLRPVNYTPASIAPANQSYFGTTPTLYKDTQGNVTVFFQAKSADANAIPSLYGFSPDNGNVASLPTGATTIAALSKTVTHGVIYAAGVIENDATTATQFPQVFAIRVDQLVQAERDFVIESQLMQDADQGAAGGASDPNNPIPPSVARYQTHLTVVDDEKNPQASEPVKIWADVDGTVIMVDGVQYTIGPADHAYASVKTGVDGSLAIMSDAKDINASALRVWAAFMDPFERIMVYPDHEWHARASSSYSDANADPSKAPDPSRPNLSTVHSYKPDANAAGSTTPKQLFTADEKTQGTPDNVANAVSQMNTGLNPGGAKPAAFAGALKTLHASNPAASYVAYTTLGGMHYGPTNARARRTATIAAPFGFALNKPQGGAHTYASLSHSDARSQIDALDGKAWDPKNPGGKSTAGAGDVKPLTFVIQRSDNIFTDFWNWLVGAFNAAVDAIENVIVSVADDIMVGINFIIDGVKQAFKAIIKVVEDVVNAIGSFFVQLAKLIEEVIEALSVLFHFGEIIWFHNWIKGLINHQVSGLKDALTNNFKNQFDDFITKGEDTIKAQFDQWRAQISGQGINDLQGGKSTMHSAFTIKDSNGNSSSQSVVAGAHTQKLKGTLGSGSETALSAAAAPKSAQDAISDFVTTFVNRVTGDGDLSAAFSQLQNDFTNLFNSSSGGQFAASLLMVLLDLLETALIGMISIAGAFFDGLFTVIDDLIAGVIGFMNTPLDIPFFSWLYKLVFGSDLTILDLAALVGAIPGTMIFRVATGVYPSQAGLPDPNSLPNGSTPVTATAHPALARNTGSARPQAAELDLIGLLRAAAGVMNGICIFALGVLSGYSDAFDGAVDVPSWVGKAGFVLGIVISALSVPVIYNDPSSVKRFDWASFGVTTFIALASGIGLFIESPATTKILTVVLAFDNACALAFVIYAYIDDKVTDAIGRYGFIGNVLSVMPGLINPAKFLGLAGKIVAVAADVLFNLAWAGLTVASAFQNLETAPAPREHRLFFPFMAVDSGNPRAIPLAGSISP